MECCISERGKAIEPKYACLRSAPKDAEGLRGLDAVIMANNHISDFGHEAAVDTIEKLIQIGVKTQGYGGNLKEAIAPLFFEINEINIGVLSFSCPTTNGWNAATPVTPGVAPLSMPLVRDQILALRPKADVVFVYLHWGVECSHYPTPGQIRAARKMIDWGANAVIGAHAHVIQPYEKYHDGFIFYGLGNAIFGDVEYRQWDLDGNITTGMLHQRPENLESLAPVFSIAADNGKTCLKLEKVLSLRYINGCVTPISEAELSVNLRHMNWRLAFYSRLRKQKLHRDKDLVYSLAHSGIQYRVDYQDSPLSSDPIWKWYYCVGELWKLLCSIVSTKEE